MTRRSLTRPYQPGQVGIIPDFRRRGFECSRILARVDSSGADSAGHSMPGTRPVLDAGVLPGSMPESRYGVPSAMPEWGAMEIPSRSVRRNLEHLERCSDRGFKPLGRFGAKKSPPAPGGVLRDSTWGRELM